MAVRRQAPKLSKADFDVYVDDLWPFPDADILAACEQIGKTEREEGETAFPTSAALIKTIRAVARARAEANPNAELDAYLADVKANSDKYVPFDIGAIAAELARKKALDPNAPVRKELDVKADGRV